MNALEITEHRIGAGRLVCGPNLPVLAALPAASVQLIIADPPYFQVLDEAWDHHWKDENAYLDWTVEWVLACRRVLRPDGLLYIFGQPGKREQAFLHLCSRLIREMAFHDLIIWDRAVGYNERSDSFTPQYEMILALRQTAATVPYFNKDAVRLPYDEATIQTYLKDKRYKDKAARERHLRKGKYATNLLRVASLKGISLEKVGHPSQKPETLIHHLIASGSRTGDPVLDPFSGSGTTAVVAEQLGRPWTAIDISPEYTAMALKRLRNRADTPGLWPD